MPRRVNTPNGPSGKLVALVQPKSVISETFRTLRTNIRFAAIDRQLGVLMVTSPEPGDGKTTVTANLAVVIAQSQQRVLLVDADLRRPMVHRVFNIMSHVGLTNTLADSVVLDDAIVKSPLEGLDLLPSGPVPPNPAELLGSEAMKRVLKNMQQRYDMVILDSPPVVPVTDAQVLANQVDGVVMVVHAGKTHRETARQARRLLEHAKGRILGVVLNNRRLRPGEDPYYYAGYDVTG